MKSVPLNICIKVVAMAMLAGCSTPAARQEARTDRCLDAADRADKRIEARGGEVEDRVTTRQDNRADRRDSRRERIALRYDY